MAAVSVILGIMSCIFGFIPGILQFALVMGLVGIGISITAIKKANESNDSIGTAVTGLVFSILGTIISITVWVCIVSCINQFERAIFG